VLDSPGSNTVEKASVVAQIVQILSPYLGATMAEASARAHCEKLGLVGATLTPEQAEALIGKIASGLAVFVGRDKAAAVTQEIRTALGTEKVA
jgi:hypothetical protein